MTPAAPVGRLYHAVALALAMLMLVFAPLLRGAKIPAALLLLELLALLLIALRAWQTPPLLPPDRLLRATLLCIVVAFLLPLVPVPSAAWLHLPGRDLVAAAMAQAQVSAGSWHALSLTPDASLGAALSLLPPLALLLTLAALRPYALRVLVYVLLAMAAMQSLVAMVQFPQGPESALRFGMQHAESSGTYTNRNHLAGMLEMALPLALAMLVVEVAAARRRFGERGALLHAMPMMHLALALAILLGLVFSRSRAGLLLGTLGTIATALLLARAGGRDAQRTLTRLLLFAGFAALAIGLAPVVQRLASTQFVDPERLRIMGNTLRGAVSLLPFGSGPGSFDVVYPWFEPAAELRPFYVNEAHNDYLQALFEGGLPLAAAVVLAIACYLRAGLRLFRSADVAGDDYECLRIGAAVGIGLILMHEAIDYNLQTPANALYFALLWGVLLRGPEGTVAARRAARQLPPS